MFVFSTASWLLSRWQLFYCCKLYELKTEIIKSYNKNHLGKTECLSNFLGYFSMPPALKPGFSYLKRSPPALSFTLTIFSCPLQASSFLIHSFINTVSQATFGYLLLTVQHVCDLQDTMAGHWSLGASHPTLTQESREFHRGNKHPKDVPLLTYLV